MTRKAFNVLTLAVMLPSKSYQFKYNSEMRSTIKILKEQGFNLNYQSLWLEFLTMYMHILICAYVICVCICVY